MKLPHRRACETVDLDLMEGQHRLKLGLGRDAEGHVNEVFFAGRGTIGHGLDDLLSELGLKISRIIQGRDPETGLERLA